MESKLFKLLYREGYVSEDNNKIVETGIKQIKYFMQDICLALILGYFMKSMRVSIVMEMVYLPLRCYSGGYHAPNEKACKYLTWGSIVCCLAAINYMPISVYLQHVLMLFSAVCIVLFSPVESRNKSLYDQEKRVFRRINLLIMAVVSLCYVGTALYGAEVYAKTICISVAMVGMGVIVEKKERILIQYPKRKRG